MLDALLLIANGLGSIVVITKSSQYIGASKKDVGVQNVFRNGHIHLCVQEIIENNKEKGPDHSDWPFEPVQGIPAYDLPESACATPFPR